MEKAFTAFVENLDPLTAFALGQGTYNDDAKEYLTMLGLVNTESKYGSLTTLGNTAQTFLDEAMQHKTVLLKLEQEEPVKEDRVANAMEGLRREAKARGDL